MDEMTLEELIERYERRCRMNKHNKGVHMKMNKGMKMTIDEFMERLEELTDCRTLMLYNKNHDYAKKDDVYANFRKCANLSGTSMEQAFMVFLAVKIARLSELITDDKDPANESILDTLSDLANYADLMNIFVSKKHELAETCKGEENPATWASDPIDMDKALKDIPEVLYLLKVMDKYDENSTTIYKDVSNEEDMVEPKWDHTTIVDDVAVQNSAKTKNEVLQDITEKISKALYDNAVIKVYITTDEDDKDATKAPQRRQKDKINKSKAAKNKAKKHEPMPKEVKSFADMVVEMVTGITSPHKPNKKDDNVKGEKKDNK